MLLPEVWLVEDVYVDVAELDAAGLEISDAAFVFLLECV